MSSLGGIKIFIDSKRLVVFRTNDSDDGKKIKVKIFESKLEKNNLLQVLLKLKEKIQVDSVNLLFADDLAVTGIVQDESNSANDREAVGRLIKAKLSIDPDRVVWDYTRIDKYYQVVCLPGDYASYIAPSFDQAGIKINSIEPISVSLAKLLAGQSEPVMLVYDETERLVMVCWQGLVYEPTLFIPVELSNRAKKIKVNFSKQFGKEVNQGVVIASFADPYVADLKALSLATEVKLLDPFTGTEVVAETITDKENIKTDTPVSGTSADIVDAEIPVEVISPITAVDTEKPEDFNEIWQENSQENETCLPARQDIKNENEKIIAIDANNDTHQDKQIETPDIKVTDTNWQKPKRNLTWLAIVIPLVITFITVGYLLIGNKNKAELYNPLIESGIDITTASPSATIISDKAKLKIQVLNGSGKAGEAAKVKGLLETAGFTVEAVGNATTSSMIKTEIKSITVLADTLKKDFQDSLSKLYDTQFTVAPVVGFDVVVTVGKSK